MRSLFVTCAAPVILAAICQAQTISTIAGTPNCCNSSDGLQATSTWLGSFSAMVRDPQGNIYTWEGLYIKRLNTSGTFTTIVGSGSINANVTNGAPNTINLAPGAPYSGLAMDSAGDLYISDTGNNVVRMLSASTGLVTTVAGTGVRGFIGDSGPATQAMLNTPSGIALDSAGNLYIADQHNNRIRKITTATGIITTVAGNGFSSYTATEGVPATSTEVTTPFNVAFDSSGTMYIAESNRIRTVDGSGMIHAFAGAEDGSQGYSGNGGPATSALMAGTLGMAFDSSGNLYVAETNNQRIRRIDTSGIITVFAGVPGNASTPLGDGGPATAAYLGTPSQLLFDPAGNLFVTASPGSWDNIRKISPAAGGGGPGLVANPASLTFAASAGGSAPPSQSVNVTSTGAALTFTAAASNTSGVNWLSVSAGGTTPAMLTVSVNLGGLAAATYKGTITLTPSSGSPVQVAVTLTVSGAGAPTVFSGGIVNATGYQAKLAPDTVFVIFGNNLGPATLQAGSAPNYPTSLGGTSITFTPTGGGTTVTAKLVYTGAGQVAGLLPSSITPGTYNVTVTYNTQTSAPQSVSVVARSFGIATSNSAGTGAAQATIGNVNGGLSLVRLTSGSLAFGGYNWTLGPAHPGDTVVLWGTGGGADSANDSGGSSGDQTVAGNFSVIVDGTSITPVYAGTSLGYPGLWQINFALPSNMAPDCFASLQVSAGGQLSNAATIAIASAGATSCSTTIPASTLSTLDSSTGTVTMAGLPIVQLIGPTGTTTTVGGVINKYTVGEFLIDYTGPKVDRCLVLQETYPANAKEPSSPDALLDAGTLTLTGGGLNQTIAKTATPNGPVYNSSISVTGGTTYTLTGSGGTQVGPFTASATMPSGFTVPNLSTLSTINRSQPLTVNWTSGTGFNQVTISISTANITSTTTQLADLTCNIPASAGTYTIPAAALSYLPSNPSVATLQVQAGTSSGAPQSAESTMEPNTIIPLVAGGLVNFGGFATGIVYTVNATVK